MSVHSAYPRFPKTLALACRLLASASRFYVASAFIPGAAHKGRRYTISEFALTVGASAHRQDEVHPAATASIATVYASIMINILFALLARSTRAARSFRQRLPDFPLIRWPALARLYFSFPLALTRNRLRNPLCDFIFGMMHASCLLRPPFPTEPGILPSRDALTTPLSRTSNTVFSRFRVCATSPAIPPRFSDRRPRTARARTEGVRPLPPGARWQNG